MIEKRVLTILELNWNQLLGHKRTKLNICPRMLTSSTQLQNRSFHVVERTRTSLKYQKMKNARAKRAKIMFFKYANLWGFCCRRRRGCLSSLVFLIQLGYSGDFSTLLCLTFTLANIHCKFSLPSRLSWPSMRILVFSERSSATVKTRG